MFADLVIPKMPFPVGPSPRGEVVQAVPLLNPVAKSIPALSPAIAYLRERIARIERLHARGSIEQSIPMDIAAMDQVLPPGGIQLGALHEAASVGPDTEHAAAATLFIAGILARLEGPIL